MDHCRAEQRDGDVLGIRDAFSGAGSNTRAHIPILSPWSPIWSSANPKLVSCIRNGVEPGVFIGRGDLPAPRCAMDQLSAAGTYNELLPPRRPSPVKGCHCTAEFSFTVHGASSAMQLWSIHRREVNSTVLLNISIAIQEDYRNKIQEQSVSKMQVAES
ncbi:hypothetical protein [Oryza sativa Japonica Group]|uniref:Uncharacterized protein P0436D06.22 n=1 Tax=Oryza sativa subsp. japonica TaxID=39947 RepID=Q5QN84_ORYSJ|nr:hypothetical protein [Oryza sativa Japonica Group]